MKQNQIPLEEILRRTIAIVPAPELTIAASVDADQIEDCLGIKALTGYRCPGELMFAIETPEPLTREELIKSLRVAVLIVESLPEVTSIEALAEALGSDLERLAV